MNRQTWIENDAVLSLLFLQWIAGGSYKSNSVITQLQDHFQSGHAGPGQLSFILKSLEEYFDYSPELKLAQLDVEMHEINTDILLTLMFELLPYENSDKSGFSEDGFPRFLERP